MKRLIFTIALTMTTAFVCRAQLKVPVQADTLIITYMSYHYEEIRPENYPYTFIVRTPQAFIFGDQTMIIKKSGESFRSGIHSGIEFTLKGKGPDKLYYTNIISSEGKSIRITYGDFIFTCKKKEL